MPSAEDNAFELNRYRLGKTIAAARKKHGHANGREYTQADMATDLNRLFDAGISGQKLSRIERGLQEPSFTLAVQISMLLYGYRWKQGLGMFAECSLSEQLKMMDRHFIESIDPDMMSDEQLALRRLSSMLTYFIRAQPEIDDDYSKPSFDSVAAAMKQAISESKETDQTARSSTRGKAIPAPIQGAVAIDEPQGKE